MVADNGGGEVI
jgi:hypothetical protein